MLCSCISETTVAADGDGLNSSMGPDPMEAYDTSEDWCRLKEVHAQQLANRMAADTDRKGEQEEAVFTSGAAVGTESFIRRLVESEEEAFPTGHKTPPVCFTVGDNKLKTLRNLRALRKR